MMILHHFAGGVYAKETHIPAGAALVQHMHEYPHLSFLASGQARVTVDGVATDYTAPAALTIEAHKHHAVAALTDVVWLCIHATDCTDPERVDLTLIEPSSQDMQALAQEAARDAFAN